MRIAVNDAKRYALKFESLQLFLVGEIFIQIKFTEVKIAV